MSEERSENRAQRGAVPMGRLCRTVARATDRNVLESQVAKKIAVGERMGVNHLLSTRYGSATSGGLVRVEAGVGGRATPSGLLAVRASTRRRTGRRVIRVPSRLRRGLLCAIGLLAVRAATRRGGRVLGLERRWRLDHGPELG